MPSLIAFTESGSVNGQVLKASFKRMDDLGLYSYERAEGLTPFALIDGHQPRIDLDFLKYINAEETHWNVCIGVSYGTSLWQVGDSNQQNGRFKMLLTEKKKEIYQQHLNTFQQKLHLMRTDFMPLVNSTWPIAFGDIQSNKKAIAERGWGPFNKNLFLHSLICANMTETIMKAEVTSGIFPLRTRSDLHNVEYIDNNSNISMKQVRRKRKASDALNFNRGVIAKHVANTIMSECNREAARERIKKLKTEGTTLQQRIMKISKKNDSWEIGFGGWIIYIG